MRHTYHRPPSGAGLTFAAASSTPAGAAGPAQSLSRSAAGPVDTSGMSVNIQPPDVLTRLLDAATLRHRVIANNLANVNTPGYHRREVAFDQAFARALRTKGEEAAAAVRPRVVESSATTARQDGNTVDVDQELGELNKNAMMFQTFTQFLAGQIATMKTAITGK
jgi:flagellar basal-body rod protein FlgB